MKDTSEHYITKAYLDKFVHPKAGQAILFPYRKGGNPCKPRGTKKLGCAINFYRQRENGELNDKLDEARKVSETLLFGSGKRNSSSIAQCVFDDGFVPTDTDRLHLATAAALLFCGSPVQIHNVAMYSLLLHQMTFFNWHNTENAKISFQQLHEDEWEQKLTESRESALTGKLFVDVGKENWRQLGFEAFQSEMEVIKLLLGMRMSILDCNYRCFFLTSDNPAVRTYPSAHGAQDDEMWFPISHKRGILWHRREMGTRNKLGYSECFAFNRRVIKHAYKYIYSPLAESWIDAAARQETYDPLYGHYGSLERVIAQSRPAFDDTGNQHGEIVDLIAAVKSGEKMDVVGI